MFQFRLLVMRCIAAAILLTMNFVALAQHLSPFDLKMPSSKELRRSLEFANGLSHRHPWTPTDFVHLYFAEKTIGRCVWGPSPPSPMLVISPAEAPKLFAFTRDSVVAAEAIAYVQSHRDRLRVVDDGWKGEDDFWEPTEELLRRIRQLYPRTQEAMAIEFDLEFNQFIRRIDIDAEARGKTCDQYYKEELKRHGDAFRRDYSAAEITNWPSECSQAREGFQVRRRQLLCKYSNAPFTKVLSDIDVTTVVVIHSTSD